MVLEPVKELDMSIWKDLWKIVVINIDRNTLKTIKLWFWIGADNLKLDNLCRVGNDHADIDPCTACSTIVLESRCQGPTGK